jgi:hypothetical protein
MPEVSRFKGPLPRAVDHLDSCEREWRDPGRELLAIRCRVSGRFLGRAGLKYRTQFDETEIGWVLNPAAWGQGYATEAGHACADWGCRDLDLSYLTGMLRPENARSIRVAERLGMTPLRRDDWTIPSSLPRSGIRTGQGPDSQQSWELPERDGVRLACRRLGGVAPQRVRAKYEPSRPRRDRTAPPSTRSIATPPPPGSSTGPLDPRKRAALEQIGRGTTSSRFLSKGACDAAGCYSPGRSSPVNLLDCGARRL